MNLPWWDRLADAIIIQAVQDYRMLGKGPLWNDPTGAFVNDIELKEFFYSEWFKQLTTLDGQYIFKKLEKERKNESIHRTGHIRPYRDRR